MNNSKLLALTLSNGLELLGSVPNIEMGTDLGGTFSKYLAQKRNDGTDILLDGTARIIVEVKGSTPQIKLAPPTIAMSIMTGREFKVVDSFPVNPASIVTWCEVGGELLDVYKRAISPIITPV